MEEELGWEWAKLEQTTPPVRIACALPPKTALISTGASSSECISRREQRSLRPQNAPASEISNLL